MYKSLNSVFSELCKHEVAMRIMLHCFKVTT